MGRGESKRAARNAWVWGRERGDQGTAACATRALQGQGNQLWGNELRINFPQFWVKEVGQTGTMARHNTPNGQKCCHNHCPVKSTVHKSNDFPCSVIITQIAPQVPQDELPKEWTLRV